MFGRGRKFAWRIVGISLVMITMAMVFGKVIDILKFDKMFDMAAMFIKSLRSSRPEGVGLEEWNESINATATAFGNVCTYDPRDNRSEEMAREILSLKGSPPGDPLDKLCKIWEILHNKSNADQKYYLDKMYAYVAKSFGREIGAEPPCIVHPSGRLTPNPALQRTRPAAAASGNIRVTLGGPVR